MAACIGGFRYEGGKSFNAELDVHDAHLIKSPDADYHIHTIAGVKASENGIDLGTDWVLVGFRMGGYRDLNGGLVVGQLQQLTGPSHQSSPLPPVPQQQTEDDLDDPSPFKWTHQAILLLISEHREKKSLFASSAMRRAEVWQLIATVMREHGYKASADACDKKWRNLKATYKNIREKQKQTGAGRITWEFYDLIDDQLFHDPSVLPKKTLGSLSGVSIVSERPRASTSSSTNPSSSTSPRPEAEGSDPVPGTSTTPSRKRKRADEPPRWLAEHLQQQSEHLQQQSKHLQQQSKHFQQQSAAMTALQESMDRRNDILEAMVQALNK